VKEIYFVLISEKLNCAQREQAVPVTKFMTIPSELEHCVSLTINIYWGPTIRTTDTEVDSLILTFKVWMVNHVRGVLG